ncbi:MAG: ABC transporter ATP-binding protein [Cytophagaceae bacterium]
MEQIVSPVAKVTDDYFHSSLSIQVKNVSVVFPTSKGEDYVAVRNINLKIKKGEIVSLIGHSGCGKSTLLNTISGLVKPTTGEVVVNYKTVKGPGPDRGVVFQNYSLLPWMSVYNNVYQAVDSVLASKSKAEKKEIVNHYLSMVNLEKHKDKLPGQISGGMKQRTAIARAFAINPKVMLLDEPFGALDALTKTSLHEELLTLWNIEEGAKTIVMVTHDIEEALFLSDKVVVMTNGPAATIGEIVEVKIPRPREKKSIVEMKEYKEARERLLYLLMEKYGHNSGHKQPLPRIAMA